MTELRKAAIAASEYGQPDKKTGIRSHDEYAAKMFERGAKWLMETSEEEYHRAFPSGKELPVGPAWLAEGWFRAIRKMNDICGRPTK